MERLLILLSCASITWLCFIKGVLSGTRMLEPPSRASLWRYGYNTPTNFNDDRTDCGGYDVHYNQNNGSCGICGDPGHQTTPRSHEAGGLYSPSPTPVRAYQAGGYIPVVMETTGTLFGKFEFRICAIGNSMTTPSQSCFDKELLTIVESEKSTSYTVGSRQGIHTLNLQLPTSLKCTHCILQWRHVTGFMTNQDTCYTCANGEPKCHVCLGCGKQMWYMGCADVAIYDFALGPPTPLQTTTTISSTTANQCTPCPSADSSDNLINVSTPYTSQAYYNSTLLPTTLSTPSSTPTSTNASKSTPTKSNVLLTNPQKTPLPPKQLTTTKPTTPYHFTFMSTTPRKTGLPSSLWPKPSREVLICYVSNRRRYPSLSVDNWCRQSCPALGNSICLFKLCMPVSCKSITGRPSVATTKRPFLTTTKTTTRKPNYLLPFQTMFHEIQFKNIETQSSIREVLPPTVNSYRQSFNWNYMHFMPYVMDNFEF